MVCWGFSADIFAIIGNALDQFIAEHGHEQSAECYLPTVIQNYMCAERHLGDSKATDKLDVKQEAKRILVETAQEPWFGVTYPQDVAWVKDKLNELVNNKNGVVS